MPTTLNLPAVIVKKVVPKPTKAEMIEALAVRKLALIKEEIAKATAVKEALSKEVTELIIKETLGLRPDGDPSSVNTGWVSNGKVVNISVRIELDNPSSELVKKRLKLEALRIPREPRLWDLKKEIRDQMNGLMSPGERVSAMLNSPEMTKALDKMLYQLDHPKPAAISV